MDLCSQDDMASVVWETERGTILKVIVRPKSRERDFVVEISPEVIIINLKSPAREGKANSELVKRMAKVLAISTGSIKLIAGHKSKEKTLLIEGLSPQEIVQCLSNVT
ncbi:MAG: hypothetical protein E3J86_01840 [Candidatus Thorarchaeota archaeon]|nr:MAG: hypothetical protein E3J86_01840 [Candidatus Thorarchaeota archaeon]